MAEEERNFFDDLGVEYDPTETERLRKDAEAKGNHLDYLIHRVFSQSEEGAELLSIWRESLIMTPTAESGLDMVGIGIGEGLKRFIRSIILTIKRVEEN